MTVSTAGTGTFSTAACSNPGATTITITNLTLGSCSSTISANNTAVFNVGCPTYSLTATSATSPVTSGNTSTVTLSGNAANLPVGTYTVYYDFSGSNTASGQTATMTVSVAGTGSFTTNALNNAGTTTITITNLENGICNSTISANNTDDITVNGLPVFDGTFESGSTFAANNMTAINGATNYWIVGTATAHGGSRSAYITNNGSANAYTNSTSQVSHFYFDYTFPTGQSIIHLTFWWKCDGETSYDNLKVFMVPTTTTPASGVALASGQIGATYYSENTTWTQVDITLDPATAGTTKRIVFSWKNDASLGDNPPIAVDDIAITTATPPSMTYVSSNTTQPDVNPVTTGSTNNNIICIQVVTSGSSSPLSVTQFSLNANGSDDITDFNAVNAAKIYYTGTSSTFATTTLFGQQTPTMANYNISGSQTLQEGTNYFWLTYDIGAGATVGHVVDAECASFVCNSVTQTPSTTAPAGTREIINQVTIGTGTNTGTLPFTTSYGYGRTAALYTSAEVLNGGSFPIQITNLAWDVSTATASVIPLKIYLKSTTLTDLATDVLWADMINGATLVYDASATFTPTGWKSFDITDFDYCGDNLLVLCETNYGGSGPGTTVYFNATYVTNITRYWNANTTPSTTLGTVSNYRPNIKINKAPASSCSGTPAAGTATASPSDVCSGSDVILSGSTTGCGITYQWEQSINSGSSWSNVAGGTTATITVNPTVETWYRRINSCSGNSSTSSAAVVTIKPATACYCTPAPTSVDGDGITNVKIGTIDNDSREELGNYGDYSYLTTNVVQGSTQTCEITYETGYTYATIIWVDWNNDGDFVDAGEEVYSGTSLSSNPTTLSATFTVPAGASLGEHRMRIGGADVGPPTPCYTGSYACFEDYTLVVISSTPCSGTPTAGTASSDISSFCNTGRPVLTLSGYTLAVGISIQWQYSASNAPYAWADILGATSTPYQVDPAINQTTYYRAVVSCGTDKAYSNVITISNNAPSITSTNSPVTQACNTAATLTAVASGGTVKWYAAANDITALATGNSYSPVVTSDITYYCAASTAGSDYNVGPATWTTGTSTLTNYGLRFTASADFTLVSVDAYFTAAGNTINIQLQSSTGVAIGSPISYTASSSGLNTIPLFLNISPGDYSLVATSSISLGYSYTGITFPYTSGPCSITASETNGSSSSSSYYYFYNWRITTSCESARVPVDVVISGGVSNPVCSNNPSPTDGEIGVCPISTVLSWSASTTFCGDATGYKLYFGTDAAATNIKNGEDIGNVTSYTFPTLLATTTYYWRIVPYNSAGDGSCATIWSFTTQADPGNVCITGMGTGVTTVAGLPYSSGPGTTSGAVNDLTSANTVVCGSSYYLDGEDRVWIFTPATSGLVTITLTSSGSYTGLMLYDNCPLSATSCGATPGNCVAYSQSSTGSKTLSVCLTGGITYYLVLDSDPSPSFNAYTDLSISAPETNSATNDLPCNATAVILGAPVQGNNSCMTGTSEPVTPTCWTTGNLNTVWFSAVCPASGALSIQTTTASLSNTQIAVYSGSCSSLTMVTNACNDNMTGCGTTYSSKLELTGLTPGATYYIRVDGAYDLMGEFSLIVIDGSSSFPTTPGQDCGMPMPTCSDVLPVSDPGYSNTGSLCDFSGDNNCTGGERASSWYTIAIAATGSLEFDIIPNDYSGGAAGDETDYDFVVWRIESTTGLPVTSCSGIAADAGTALVACNYSYLGVTGCSGTGDCPLDAAFNGAYEPAIPVIAGEKYLITISNYTQSTSGFKFDFTPSPGIVNYADTPVLVSWNSGAGTDVWNSGENWGGCFVPSCEINAVISSISGGSYPVITAAQEVKDITINAGTTLAINEMLTVCGNFTNNGTVTFGVNGGLEFIGTSGAQILNSATPLSVSKLTINNPDGLILAGNNITIPNGGLVTLTDGIIYTSNPSPLIIFEEGAAVNIGNANSYIDGPVQKVGSSAFVFPLGDGGRWSNLGISAPTSSSTFQAQYFATPYTNVSAIDLTQGTATMDHVSGVEYWQLDRIAGTGNASVTLNWSNATLSDILECSDYTELSVAKWTGSAWTNLNTTGGTYTGSCGGAVAGSVTTQSEVTSFSPFTFGTLLSRALNPLPVQIIQFSGRRNGHFNSLTWKTASEVNNDYFIVEKSEDGISFQYLNLVKGAGNSNSEMKYQLSDAAPYENITYYRLKQVDFDGRFSYSNVISIKSSDYVVWENIHVYPNPFNEEIIIETEINKNAEMSVAIIDLVGNIIKEQKFELPDVDKHKIKFNVIDIPKGMYFILIHSGEARHFEKIIKN